MLKNINIVLPQEIVNLITIQNEKLTDKLKEIIIFGLYREHRISAGKAAEILEITKEAFIHFSSAKGIPHIDQSKNDVNDDSLNLENTLNENHL